MYGYEPPKPTQEGSCREALLFSWIALGVVVPVIAWIVFGISLIIAALLLLIIDPLYSLIPIAMLVVLLGAIVVRDRRLQREMEADINDPDGSHGAGHR